MPAIDPVDRKNSAMPRRRVNQRLMTGVSATGLQEFEGAPGEHRPQGRRYDNGGAGQQHEAGTTRADQVARQRHGQAIAQHADRDDAREQAARKSQPVRHRQEERPDAHAQADRQQGEYRGGANDVPAEIPAARLLLVQVLLLDVFLWPFMRQGLQTPQGGAERIRYRHGWEGRGVNRLVLAGGYNRQTPHITPGYKPARRPPPRPRELGFGQRTLSPDSQISAKQI
ncbi:hypothetical protein G6F65_019109 [Rhizopus arrhizus]|nr:hypothetical protein G6F65_019109 [Rhizopus arrhizus]